MSEPQQPPVPPSAQPNPAFPPAPPAPHLPAAPQYPAAPQQHAPQPSPPPYSQPQQQYASQPQQHYPAQQQQHYPAQQPSVTPRSPAPGSGNSLARTAFIVALVVAAIGALQILTQPFVLSSFGYDAGSYGAFSLVFGVIIFLGNAAALVLGLIAARRPGGHILAGIAIGVGGVQLLGIVLGWISSLFYNFF